LGSVVSGTVTLESESHRNHTSINPSTERHTHALASIRKEAPSTSEREIGEKFWNLGRSGWGQRRFLFCLRSGPYLSLDIFTLETHSSSLDCPDTTPFPQILKLKKKKRERKAVEKLEQTHEAKIRANVHVVPFGKRIFGSGFQFISLPRLEKINRKSSASFFLDLELVLLRSLAFNLGAVHSSKSLHLL
jgi:hypothetical protein